MMESLQLTPNLGADGKAGTDDDSLALSYLNPYPNLTLVWQVVSGTLANPVYTTIPSSAITLPTISGGTVTRASLSSYLSSFSSPIGLRVLADDDTNLGTDSADTTPPIASPSVDLFSPTNVDGTFNEGVANGVITLKFNEAVTIDGAIQTALTDTLINTFKAALGIVLNPSQAGGADIPSGTSVGITGISGLGTDTLTITTNKTFISTDIVRVAYPNPTNASGRLTDTQGNPLTYQQLWIGGSGANAVDLGDYWADRAIYVRGNGGNDTLTGGFGNDVLLDGTGVDTLNGGRGSDVHVLVEYGFVSGSTSSGFSRDTIFVELGESVTGLSGALRDVVQPSATKPTDSGFDIVSSDFLKHDVLSLPSGQIAQNTTFASTSAYQNTSGSNVAFKKFIVSSGIVTFKDSSDALIVLNSSQKATDAITFLSKNWSALPAGNTVALPYDRDANGTVDSLLIFQQGGLATAGQPANAPSYLPATHLYIKDLVGAATATLSNSEGSGVVQVIDTQMPNPINLALLGDTTSTTGLGIDFAERVSVTGSGGMVIKQNGVTNIPFSASVGSSGVSVTATFTSALNASDWVLMTLGGVDGNNFVTDLFNNSIPASDTDPTWGGLVLGSAGANTIDLGNTQKFDPTKEYQVSAGAGNDVIQSSDGVAYIVGGQGADTVTGGGGQDEFEFVQGDSPTLTVELGNGAPTKFSFTAGADVVSDLSAGEQIRLTLPFQDVRGLNGLTPMGTGVQAFSGAMPTDGLATDQAFFVVRGAYSSNNGGAFTVDAAAGADTLIVYDGDSSSKTSTMLGTSNTGLVLKGVIPSDLFVYNGGVTLNGSAVVPATDNPPAFGNPPLVWDANNTPLDTRDDKLIVSVTDDDNDGSPGKTLLVSARSVTDGYSPVMGSITNGTDTTSERVDFDLQPKTDGTFYSLSFYGPTGGTQSGSGATTSELNLSSSRFYGNTAPTAADIVASLVLHPNYATLPFTLSASGTTISATFKQMGDVTSSLMLNERTPVVGAPIQVPTLIVTAAETPPGSVDLPEIQTLTLSPTLVAGGVYALKLGSYGSAIVASALDSTPTAAELAAALNAAASTSYPPVTVSASGTNLTLTWNAGSDISDVAKLFTLAPAAPVSGGFSASALRSGIEFAGLTSVSAIRVTATETFGANIQSTSMDIGLPSSIIQSVEASTSAGYGYVAEGAQLTYLVRLNSPAPAGGFEFDWRIAPPSGTSATGGATAADFVAASGKVSVIGGATTGSFTVSVADDTESEYSEYFGVQVGTTLDGVFTQLHADDAHGSIQESDNGGTEPPVKPGDPSIVTGTAGPDSLTAPSGEDTTLLGLDGNDTVDGLDEGDIFIGGNGSDLAKFAGNASDYVVQKATTGQIDTIKLLVPGAVTDGQDVYAIQHKTGATSWAFVQAEQLQFGTAAPVDPLTLLTGGGGGGVSGGELIVNSSLTGSAYASISAAITAATAGATILVAAGHVETNASSPIWVSKDNLHIVIKATNLPVLTFQLEEVDTVKSLYLFGGTGANIIGNSTDNILLGTQGNDSIDGRGGNDKLIGTDGADHLMGGAGNDWLDGGSGWDMLWGGFGDDTLLADEGGASTDTGIGAVDLLSGGSGNDLLIAGESGSAASKIRMLGGSGSDTFRVANLNGAGSSTTDPAVADSINLNAFIADLSAADGLDLSALRASAAASQPIASLLGAVVSGSGGDWAASLAGLYAVGVQGAPGTGGVRPAAPVDQVLSGSALSIAMVNDAGVTAAMGRSLGAPSNESIIDSMMPVYGPLEQFDHQYFG